jgi:hypothetical protein
VWTKAFRQLTGLLIHLEHNKEPLADLVGQKIPIRQPVTDQTTLHLVFLLESSQNRLSFAHPEEWAFIPAKQPA